MTDILDKVLDNMQTQIDKEAEEKRKAEEAERKAEEDRRKADEDRRKAAEEKNKKIERFSQAVKENQIDEVKEMMSKNIPYTSLYYSLWQHTAVGVSYLGIRLNPPSVEMAQLLIDDARKHKASKEFEEEFILVCIKMHPEMAGKWDKFAKDNKISYDFKTSNKELFDKLVEQGFDVQCFDFEESVNIYYAAKNGYISRDYGGTRYTWNKIDRIEAKKIKNDLIDVLNKGYKIDLSNKDTGSYAFMKELLKERELQKQGVDKSFVYRDDWEKFYDTTTGQCRLTIEELSNLGIYYGERPTRFSEKYTYNDLATGIIKNGIFSGYIRSKYYENGIDVTEKHELLQKIEDRCRAKKEKLKSKKLPKVVEELGKAQINLNSKIEAVIAVKKAGKAGRK